MMQTVAAVSLGNLKTSSWASREVGQQKKFLNVKRGLSLKSNAITTQFACVYRFFKKIYSVKEWVKGSTILKFC